MKLVNQLRNMNGAISGSILFENKLILNMKDGSFKSLNVEGNTLHELVDADPSI